MSISRSPRVSPLAQGLIVSGLILGVVGPALVFPKIRSAGWIMDLDDGALVGSIIAVLVAIGFAATVLLTARKSTRRNQAIISVALAGLAIAAVVFINGRVRDGESVGAAVTVAIVLYAVAAAIEAGAAVVGFVRAARTPV